MLAGRAGAKMPGVADRLVDAFGQAVIITSPDGVVVTWSPYAETLYGWTAAEALGRSILELTPSPDAADQAAEVIQHLRAGETWSGEFPVRRKDGTSFVAFVTDTAVCDDNGEIVAIVGVSHDVTERRAREEELRQNDELLRLTLDVASVGTFTWDFTVEVFTWDRATEELFGFAPGTFDGSFASVMASVHSEDRARVARQIAEARDAGRGVTVEFRAVWPDGSVHWLFARGHFLYDDAGNPVTMIGIAADIDERKRGEAAVAEAARARTDHDRRAIQVLHEVLIRPEFPFVEGFDIAARYLPADRDTSLGGDWYDVFELPDHRIMIVIGDVAGHGIRAARLMAKLRHATRAYACIEPDLIPVVTHLDRFLEHFSTADEFATIQLAVLDPETGGVDLVSAGHPPALFIEDEQDARPLPVLPLPPIGWGHASSTGPKPIHATLTPATGLVFYTDGLVERRDEPIDDGIQRLARGLAGATTSDELCDAAIRACLLDRQRNDDVCVIAVRHLASG